MKVESSTEDASKYLRVCEKQNLDQVDFNL